MNLSLIRRACVAAVVVASTMAPAVAAQTDDTGARGGTAALSDIGAKARLLGERSVPHKHSFRGTTVGELSGIDRDPCTGEYIAISDDRSVLQPARFYTARIAVDSTGVHAVEFAGTHPLLQPDGAVYPALHAGDGKVVDPEEVRVDPQSCDLLVGAGGGNGRSRRTVW
ncbi:esterase-like activity of phytase family protein [Streptomyces anulatus]